MIKVILAGSSIFADIEIMGDEYDVGGPVPLSLTDRTNQILERPDLMDLICTDVANGGDLVSFCRDFDVRFGTVANWIHKDIDRDRRYQQALIDRQEWGMEQVLKELRLIGLADIREIFNSDGTVRPVHEWPELIARAISSIEVFEEFQGQGKNREFIGYTKRIKFWDKGKALELLGKNLKLFTDKIEHGGTVKLEDLILGTPKTVSQ